MKVSKHHCEKYIILPFVLLWLSILSYVSLNSKQYISSKTYYTTKFGEGIKWRHNYLITGGKIEVMKIHVLFSYLGAGFIGSHLTNRLLGEWNPHSLYRLIIVDNFTDYYSPRLKQRNIDNLIKRYPRRVSDGSFVLIRGSINDRHLMKTVFDDFQITHVAHLAVIIFIVLTFFLIYNFPWNVLYGLFPVFVYQ